MGRIDVLRRREAEDVAAVASTLVQDQRLDSAQLQAILDAIPAAIYTTDAEGTVTYFNRAAAELAGREPVIGKDKWCVTWRLRAMNGEPIAHDECPMAVALRERRPVRGVEAIAERPDGRRVPFLPFPTPMYGPDGEMVGAVNVLVDISDRKETEAARRRAEQVSQQLASIVESSVDAIVSKDLDGVITSWNRGAERLFGYSAREAIGRPITMLFPADLQGEEPRILERIRRGELVEPFETIRQRKDGSRIDISLTVSPIRDPDGRIVGASKIARDIGERKRAERALALRSHEQGVLYGFTDRLHRAGSAAAVF